MEKGVDISIIIVSYNTADLIGACLDSLKNSLSVNVETIIVDNASGDGSVDFVTENYPDVFLITNNANRGFAAANNQGLSRCRGRYIFFLNPDTEVMPGAIDGAVSFMDANPHVGLAGLKIVNPDGTTQNSVSYKYPGQRYATGELKGLKGPIACVLGAAMVAREECLEGTRGFDEDFFLYGEDQDLCLRIRKMGYEIGYIEEALVLHHGGQSERKSKPEEVWRKKTRAEYRFYRKHYFPRTIARITAMELLKARFRIMILKLSLLLSAKNDKARNKLIKYMATSDEMQQERQQMKTGREC